MVGIAFKCLTDNTYMKNKKQLYEKVNKNLNIGRQNI